MLFTLLKELTDRFIEFILNMVKGANPEAQLTSALKSCVFLITILAFAVISLGISNYNLHLQNDDFETAVSKFGFLLKEDNLVAPSLEIAKLSASIDANSNALRKENVTLSENNIALLTENAWIQVMLSKILEENKLLKANNQVLLDKCVARKF